MYDEKLCFDFQVSFPKNQSFKLGFWKSEGIQGYEVSK